jgi:hypothetical protein
VVKPIAAVCAACYSSSHKGNTMTFGKHKHTAHTEGIVVGDTKKHVHVKVPKLLRFKHPNKRAAIIGSAAMLGIVAIGVGGWLYRQSTIVTVYDVPDMNDETVTAPAQDEALVIDPATEVADIEKQIAAYPKENLNAKERIVLANLYSALGAAHTNLEQGDKAISAYQNAGKYASEEQQRTILSGKAYAYASVNLTDKAIEAFEDLITYVKQHPNSSSDRDIAGIQRSIEQLRKGEPL